MKLNKSFYNEFEVANNDAAHLQIAIDNVIGPIIDVYVILGYTRREIGQLIIDEISRLTAEKIVRFTLELKNKKA